MSGLRDYTSVAASNTSLFPENMNPSAVDDGMRQVQADVVNGYRDSQWADWGDSPSKLSATTFQLSGDVTSRYMADRRIRCNDYSTLYGAITDCTFSGASSVITVELDSGSLTSSLTAVAIGSLTPSSLSIPKNILHGTQMYAADAGSTDAYAITLSPPYVSREAGTIIRFKANTANTGACSLNPSGLGNIAIKKNVSSDLDDNDILAGQFVTVIDDGTNFQLLSPPANSIPPHVDTLPIVKGSSDATKLVRIEADGLTTATTRVWNAPDTDLSQFLVQVVNTETGAVASGTTIIPDDDTIPQNTEGDQYMSLSITPKSTNNILYIDVTADGAFTTIARGVIALFQDSTANALAAIGDCFNNGAGIQGTVHFRHKMTAGTTSATTFKIRIGGDAGQTFTLNGAAGARKFGGVIASSITITEVSP